VIDVVTTRSEVLAPTQVDVNMLKIPNEQKIPASVMNKECAT
jgi:hypothetical protein